MIHIIFVSLTLHDRLLCPCFLHLLHLSTLLVLWYPSSSSCLMQFCFFSICISESIFLCLEACWNYLVLMSFNFPSLAVRISRNFHVKIKFDYVHYKCMHIWSYFLWLVDWKKKFHPSLMSEWTLDKLSISAALIVLISEKNSSKAVQFSLY